MTIKMTVRQERQKVVELGGQYAHWYDTRIDKITEDIHLSSDIRRTKQRSIYTRTLRKFEKDTGQIKTRKIKRKAVKSNREDYFTYAEFETAVLKTVPPLVDKQAMSENTFYVYPLETFFKDSLCPADHFIGSYTAKFGEAPENAILMKMGGRQMLALGAVPVFSKLIN